MNSFDFALGELGASDFPTEVMASIAWKTMAANGASLAKYPSKQGLVELRSWIAKRYYGRGLSASEDQVVLTNGSLQAIQLATQALNANGSAVLVDEYSYVMALRIFRRYGGELIGIPADAEGMSAEQLTSTIQSLLSKNSTPSFIYVIPNFHNPTGRTMSLARRKQIAAVADKYGIPLIEDDCYSEVTFSPQTLPTVSSLLHSAAAVNIGTFSKIVAPGLRLGYFVGSAQLVSSLLSWKLDGGTNELAALILCEFLTSCIDDHLEHMLLSLQNRRDRLLEALKREFYGTGATWTSPDGGFFTWVHLPEPIDMDQVKYNCDRRGVRLSLGQQFHSKEISVPYVRLSFSGIRLEDIDLGIHLFGLSVAESRLS